MLSEPASVPPAGVPAADISAAVVGYIDALEERRIAGWAWCRTRPDAPVEVEFRLDGVALKRVVADGFRPDLARAGAGDGKHAFNVILEAPLPVSQPERLTAFIVCGEKGPFVPLINRTGKPPEAVASRQNGASPVARPGPNLQPMLTALATVQKRLDDRIAALGADLRVEMQSGAQSAREQLATLTSSTDVLQTRLDAICAALQERSSAAHAAKAADRNLAIIVAFLGLLSCASLVLGLIAVLR